MTGPASPLSPRSISPALPLSPKRSFLLQSRQSRSASKIVQIIRQRIPVLLRAVATDVNMFGDMNTPFVDADGGVDTSADFVLSKRAVNALGFVLGGGVRPDQEVRLSYNMPPPCS